MSIVFLYIFSEAEPPETEEVQYFIYLDPEDGCQEFREDGSLPNTGLYLVRFGFGDKRKIPPAVTPRGFHHELHYELYKRAITNFR